jgi:hypothetical protein
VNCDIGTKIVSLFNMNEENLKNVIKKSSITGSEPAAIDNKSSESALNDSELTNKRAEFFAKTIMKAKRVS